MTKGNNLGFGNNVVWVRVAKASVFEKKGLKKQK